MQKNEQSPCEKVTLGFDTKWGYIEKKLEEWYKTGPGPTYPHARPSSIYCETDKRPLSPHVIDLEYRNNFLSQFLIACGLFPFPWSYNKASYPEPYWQLPELLSLIQGDKAPREFPSFEMQKQTDALLNERISYTIPNGKTISFHIPENYQTQFASLSGFPSILVHDRMQKLNDLLGNKVAREQHDKFLLAIQQSHYWSTEIKIFGDYLPNESFASTVSTNIDSREHYDFYSVLMDSEKYDVSVLVFEALLKIESPARFSLRCFGLTAKGQGLPLIRRVEEIFDTLSYLDSDK